VVVSADKIQWVGRQEDLKHAGLTVSESLDATGKVVLPGLIDAHTHTVFAGTREKEYELRMMGVSYMEIAAQGGGINATVSEVRKASLDELVRTGRQRLASMLRRGTTTVEIKSGYGLNTLNELKMLDAISRLNSEVESDIVPTFLGAHEIPPEFRDHRERYIDLVVDEMIPAVAEKGLAEFCDVFCEQGVFSAEEARRVLLRGRDYGLKPKIHADEFADSGAASVAGEVGAVSAGHLGLASQEGLESMLRAGTVAVLLPGVAIGLGEPRFADARKMLEMGLDVAVATDFNPGSSMLDSLLIAGTLACSFMRMTASEVILAMTLNAAKAVDRSSSLGSIIPGKQADLVVFEAPDFRYIPYHFGGDIVHTVVKRGTVVVNHGSDGGCD
jgi:imidazolonepropionase